MTFLYLKASLVVESNWSNIQDGGNAAIYIQLIHFVRPLRELTAEYDCFLTYTRLGVTQQLVACRALTVVTSSVIQTFVTASSVIDITFIYI